MARLADFGGTKIKSEDVLEPIGSILTHFVGVRGCSPPLPLTPSLAQGGHAGRARKDLHTPPNTIFRISMTILTLGALQIGLSPAEVCSTPSPQVCLHGLNRKASEVAIRKYKLQSLSYAWSMLVPREVGVPRFRKSDSETWVRSFF